MAWHDDDPFWHDFAPLMFHQGRLDGTPAEVDGILSLTGLAAGRVLDCPCGPGRHSNELARRGFEVVGVDRTAAYLDQARQADSGADFRLGDMRTVNCEPVDLVLNYYSSFGYFEDPADDHKTLRAFHDCLRPGGQLLLEMMGLETLAMQWSHSTVVDLPDGLMVEQRQVLPGWTAVETRWTLLRGTEQRTHTMRVRLYGAHTITEALRAAGFETPRLFGAIDGRPYDHRAKRLVVLARRPA